MIVKYSAQRFFSARPTPSTRKIAGHIFVKQPKRAHAHGDQRKCFQQLERGDDPQAPAMSTFSRHTMGWPFWLAGNCTFPRRNWKRTISPGRFRGPAGAEVSDRGAPGSAAFIVGEIDGADGGDAYKHQDGGEQGEDNQGSLLVLSD